MSGYHRLEVRAETLTVAEAARIERETDDDVEPALYFARNLSYALRVRKMSATFFADCFGVDDRRMRRLAAGDVHPHYEEIPTFAKRLDVDPAKLAWSPPAAFRISLRRAS